jgi:hypothetical protein
MSVSVRKLRRFRKESECRVHNVCTTAFWTAMRIISWSRCDDLIRDSEYKQRNELSRMQRHEYES